MKKEILNRIKHPEINIDFVDVEDAVDVRDHIRHSFFGLSGANNNSFIKKKNIRKTKIFPEPKNSERTEVIRDLEDFISQLQDFKITPILFACPTYKSYNALQSKQTLNKNLSDIKIICNKYNIDYWNYMNDSTLYKK